MENKKTKKNDFSVKEGNLEIVPHAENKDKGISDGAVSVSREGIDVKKGGNIIIGSLNIITNPIKKRNEKHYKSSKFHLIADLALVLVMVALLVTFFVFRNLEPKLDVSVEASTASEIITSGKVETFEIEYENNSDEIVENSSLSVNLPEGFVLTNTIPNNIFNNLTNTFKIGDLEPGSSGKVKVSGLVLGETGDRQVIAFSLNYTEGARKANSLGSLVYAIEDSVLGVEWNAPKDIYKDINFSSKIIIKNLGNVDLEKDIEISFVDSGLLVKRVNRTEVTLNNNIISLSGLKKESSIEIDIEAVASTDEENLSATINSFINTGEKRLEQQEIKKVFKVSVPKFNASVSTQKKAVKENESVIFSLDYENKEEEPIKQIRFDIAPSDSAFSISKLELKDANESFSLNGNSINFSDNLAKGEKGNIKFEIVFKRKNIKTNQEIGVSTGISYQLMNDTIEYRIPSSKVKLISDLQISSKGFYYSTQGDQLGIGPLPPAISIPTRYWIFWEFDNLGNNLENVSITATLPDNVFWTDQKSLTAGKMRFGQIGKKVAWIMDSISMEEEKGRAGFEVELVPGSKDLGKIVNLLENIEYSAYDSFAQKEIKGNLLNIDTDLKYDNLAGGKGKVIKMDIIQ